MVRIVHGTGGQKMANEMRLNSEKELEHLAKKLKRNAIALILCGSLLVVLGVLNICICLGV